MNIKRASATEKDLYDFLWLDPDKSVYVLQNKVYKKALKFYFGLSYLSGATSEFQSTDGYGASLGFYIEEEWAIELNYNYYQNSKNTAYENLYTVLQLEPFIRRMNTSYGALLVWAPFYGKINTFNKIFYFDWSFAIGYSILNGESNAKTVAQKSLTSTYESETFHALSLKTTYRFHVTKSAHVEIAYLRNIFYGVGPYGPNQEEGKNLIRTNNDLIFGVGMTL